MANKNAFLGVHIDEDTVSALDDVAKALEDDAARLLGMPQGTGFDAQETASLHMTFLFFGEYLRALPAAELKRLHEGICTRVSNALAGHESPTTPLVFQGFELFPPGKMNLVVARFQPSESLLALRQSILDLCHESGVSLPASFFSLIAGEGAWSPHVTLGKIRASREAVGRASCQGAEFQALAPRRSAIPLGLTLLGERPPRAWCDWDGPLAFGPQQDTSMAPVELRRDLSSVYGSGASKYDEETLTEWETTAKAAVEILNASKQLANSPERDESLKDAARLFQDAARLRPDFARAYLGGCDAFTRLGQRAEAKEILILGLEHCAQDERLARTLQKLEAELPSNRTLGCAAAAS